MIRYLTSLALAIFCVLTLSLAIAQPVQALPQTNLQRMGVIPGLGKLFAGTPPDHLGLHDHLLAPCPETHNCVTSQSQDPVNHIEAIPYQGDRKTAQQLLLKVLSVVPRTQIIEETPDYIRVEFTTQLLGFVDDGEFYFPQQQNLIQVRSASRLGESDLNLNQRRIEQIRLAMQDLGA